MPDGKSHNFATVVMAASAGIIAHRLGYPMEVIQPVVSGTLLGLLLTPDLDVDGGSIANHNARRVGGCALGLAWAMIWKPYAVLVPHRSVISHTPVLGTAIRLGYLALLIWLLAYVFHFTGLIPVIHYQPWMLYVFAGLCLADTLHYFMDITFRGSGGKRYVRKARASGL